MKFSQIISKNTGRSPNLPNSFSGTYLLCKSFLNVRMRDRKRNDIGCKVLSVASETDIVINLLGQLDLGSDPDRFEADLESLGSLLDEADFTFALTQFGRLDTPEHAKLRKQAETLRLMDVSKADSFIHSVIYKTYAGNVALCGCMLNHPAAAEIQVQDKLIREYYTLKYLGADYVIMYLDGKLPVPTDEQDPQLVDLLLKAGVGDIVHMESDVPDSSLSFLSGRDNCPDAHTPIQIKLRKIKGKLRVFEENLISTQPVGETATLK